MSQLEIIFGLKAFLPTKAFANADFELFSSNISKFQHTEWAACFLDDFSQIVKLNQLHCNIILHKIASLMSLVLERNLKAFISMIYFIATVSWIFFTGNFANWTLFQCV